MVQIIAEIGINHNGDLSLCKELITIAKNAGCNYVKIQKRNPEKCVPLSQRDILRQTPWGEMTYLDYKKRLEFSPAQIQELIQFSQSVGIEFFASVWDLDSVQVMSDLGCRIGKIPSALITNHELCQFARQKFPFLIVSTGMSTEEEVESAISICQPDVIMHTNSTYPSPIEDLNLNYIIWLQQKYGSFASIGYSGHEYGLVTTFAAVGMGAEWIERHITKDRTMWGSDQLSSIEPVGLVKLVKGIRDIEQARQYPVGPRKQFETELLKMRSLRG